MYKNNDKNCIEINETEGVTISYPCVAEEWFDTLKKRAEQVLKAGPRG